MATSFVEESVRAICENGKQITWDVILAFRTFKTPFEARTYVDKWSLDVFSYYKNELQCVTLLSKLIDFNPQRPDVFLPIIQHLLDDAKEKGVLAKCAQSPCLVSMEHSVVYKPFSVLIRAPNRRQFIPYLVVTHEFDWWCVRNRVVARTAIQDCAFCFNPDGDMAVLLDCIRPPALSLSGVKAYSMDVPLTIDRYTLAGDACRAMAWCCRKENAGGVWYDLWVCVAERWDYRVDSHEVVRTAKRLKK